MWTKAGFFAMNMMFSRKERKFENVFFCFYRYFSEKKGERKENHWMSDNIRSRCRHYWQPQTTTEKLRFPFSFSRIWEFHLWVGCSPPCSCRCWRTSGSSTCRWSASGRTRPRTRRPFNRPIVMAIIREKSRWFYKSMLGM